VHERFTSRYKYRKNLGVLGHYLEIVPALQTAFPLLRIGQEKRNMGG
jgi:hypothetical protein